MKESLLFLSIAGVGAAIYHLGQKGLAANANPMAILMVVYLLSFILAAIAFPFFRHPNHHNNLAPLLSWSTIAVALGVILVECGFLLAYRSGSALHWSGVVVSAITILLLLPMAIFFWGEKVTPVRAIGILVTLSGMILITKK